MAPLKKILIVDDERGIRKCLERSIRKKLVSEHINFDIRLAENGEQCIELAKQDRPDIILMDIRMPVMDGLQACSILRSNPAFNPTVIFILTAEMAAEVKGLSSGADDYITKPFDMSALLLRVEHGLHVCEERSESLRDPETGLWHRNYFEQSQLAGELCRAKRHDRDLSLLITEFDFPIGLINEKGNIKAVINELGQFFEGRTSDTYARWGARSFAALLPETGEVGALNFAERLRNDIAKFDSRLHTTIGISVFDPTNQIEAIAAFAETSLAVARDAEAISINGHIAATY